MGVERVYPMLGRTVIAGVLLAAVSVSPGHAEPVRLVTGPDYAPFADPDLPEGGLVPALARAAYDTLGREVEIAFRPWSRGYHKTLRGKYTATLPYVETPERKDAYRYSDPLYTVRRKPMVMADSDVRADDLGELSGHIACLPVGYAPARRVQDMLADGDLRRHKPMSMRKCLRTLERGRVDFVLVNSATEGPALARERFGGTDAVRFLDIPIRQTLHAIFPREREGVQAELARFNEGLQRLRERGRYERIVNRFVNRRARDQ